MAETFGSLTNYFGVTGNALMLVASDSGTDRRVTNLWNGAYEQGAELANPVCTFRVKAAGYVTFVIGKAWNNANGKYMLTEVEYATGADREPVLTLRGMANEGADAVTTKSVTFAVSPFHVAQDPFGAVSGGGELVECTSAVTCDAAVPYENNAPCASDVCNFRAAVSATTNAYDGAARPTAANGFIASGVPKQESDVDFTSYAFAAGKGL